MIVDYLENAGLYFQISPAVKETLSYLQAHPERTELMTMSTGATLKILPYTTVEDDKRKWEAHDHIIDIHCVVEGTEDFLWSSRKELKYLYKEPDKDVHRFEGEGTRITLKPGMFAILFPEDAHKTKLAHAGKAETVLKGIIKIPV